MVRLSDTKVNGGTIPGICGRGPEPRSGPIGGTARGRGLLLKTAWSVRGKKKRGGKKKKKKTPAEGKGTVKVASKCNSIKTV